MVESAGGTDLDALIAQLSTMTSSEEPPKARLVVAADWGKAAMPVTALRAFRTLVPLNAPIELVFAVPHEPTETDAACVNVLVEELGAGGDLTGLDLQSFDVVGQEPYDAALVATGDYEADVHQLGGFILRIRDLVRIYEIGRGHGGAGVTENRGDLAALRERLANFA